MEDAAEGMNHVDAAAIATRVFMQDLRDRSGFSELIASISEWPKIEAFMQSKVAAELLKAEIAAQPRAVTEEIGFE